MDRGWISFNPHEEKNRISQLLVESPDFFFHEATDFPLVGVGRSV